MLELEKHGDVTRVVASTWRSRAAGYSVSAYLVRGVLIDTAFPAVRREMDALIDRVRPDGILLTHWHEDHAGNIAAAIAAGLPVKMAPATRDTLLRPIEMGLYRRAIWGMMKTLSTAPHGFDPGALSLLHAPGHSPDHHVVWDAELGTLFAGDLFLGVKVRVARPGEDPRTLVRSLRAAAALEPRRMFDGHRGLVPDAARSLSAKADWLETTIAAIDRRIADGLSDRAIARAVLGREAVANYVSFGDLSRLNLVRALRAIGAP